MASFATYSDLETRVNQTFTAAQRAQATMLLAEASSKIAGETGQQISLATDDEVVLVGNWSSRLVLPQWPVVNVTAVTIDTTALTVSTGYTWDGQRTLYRGAWANLSGYWRPYPQDVDLYWGGPSAQVTVTYSHGFSAIPPAIQGVCMAMAWREMQDPAGTTTSKTIGPFSQTSSAGTGALSMTADERRTVRRALGLR